MHIPEFILRHGSHTPATANRDRRWRLPPWKIQQRVTASEVGQVVPWGLTFAGIGALQAESKGEGIKVAVLDTGIDQTHPDLAPQVALSRDFSGSAYGIIDRQGHGTHTAGTIAAVDNGIGIVGLAPACKLMIGKVLGDDGSGSMDAIAEGIRWAVDSGAQVISMSLGSPDPADSVRDALAYAAKHGVFCSCAAGNDGHLVDRRTGKDIDTVDYPGKWTDLCTCVGAHDDKGKIAEFSSRGPEVDLLAPGVHVLSCWPGGGYAFLDGTSMATPFVAGTIALLLSYRKAKGIAFPQSQADLEAILTINAIPIGEFGAGHGLVNPKDLLASIPTAPTPAGGSFRYGPFTLGGYDWELTATPHKS